MIPKPSKEAQGDDKSVQETRREEEKLAGLSRSSPGNRQRGQAVENGNSTKAHGGPQYHVFQPTDTSSFNQVFHTTPDTFAIVNIKPLLPGHILVCPLATQSAIDNQSNNLKPGPYSHSFNQSRSPNPNLPSISSQICPASPPKHLSDLNSEQTAHLFQTVQRLTPTLRRIYSARAFNVAIQDGFEAGQSVGHVHVHVVPRRGKEDVDGLIQEEEDRQRGGGRKEETEDVVDEKDKGDVLYEVLEREGAGYRDESCAQRARNGDRTCPENQYEEGHDRKAIKKSKVRRERNMDEMIAEANMLRAELAKDGVLDL